jgi:hypothetical protein
MQGTKEVQMEGDMRNILRVLSVRNAAPDLDIVVQLASGENRKAIVEAGVSVVCCADEINMRILAKSTLCPGFGTFITNMVTMLDESDEPPQGKPGWLREYEAGLIREIYYAKLPDDLMKSIVYDWQLFVELNYTRFNVLLLGVCNEKTRNVRLNPLREDIRAAGNEEKFYKNHFNRVVLLAVDGQQVMVDDLRNPLTTPSNESHHSIFS